MRVAILSMYNFDEVKGGTELFVRHMQKVFPEAENITYSSRRSLRFLPDLTKMNLQYERMGMAISRSFAFEHRRDPFDLVFCNDISGIGLKIFTPQVPAIQVFHYTYKGFADGAMKGSPGYWPSRYLHPLSERATSMGKTIVAVSHKTRRELESRYGLSAHVIENAVSLDHFRPLPKDDCRARLGIKWDGALGIFVGRTDSTKGFEVVRAIASKRKDLKILCVTGNDVDESNLIIAKRVPNEDMPTYYSAADFLLFPSRYESASYTAIEALACGIPIVAHRTGLFEDIEEREVGRILEHVDTDLFSKAIDDVLELDDINTRKLAERRFSMDRFIQEYRDLGKRVARTEV